MDAVSVQRFFYVKVSTVSTVFRRYGQKLHALNVSDEDLTEHSVTKGLTDYPLKTQGLSHNGPDGSIGFIDSTKSPKSMARP
jgi:hypothetical protein